jgi:hypothetical protein
MASLTSSGRSNPSPYKLKGRGKRICSIQPNQPSLQSTQEQSTTTTPFSAYLHSVAFTVTNHAGCNNIPFGPINPFNQPPSQFGQWIRVGTVNIPLGATHPPNCLPWTIAGSSTTTTLSNHDSAFRQTSTQLPVSIPSGTFPVTGVQFQLGVSPRNIYQSRNNRSSWKK